MKIAVITTSRADWNCLGMVAAALRDGGFNVDVMVSGPHITAGTSEVVAAEFPSYYHCASGWYGGRVMPNASAFNIAGCTLESLGAGVFWRTPDMAMVAGDRYETLAAATAVAMRGIPLAHLSGGDVTLGSTDNAFRNAISMLASLHFPSNMRALARLIQMGVPGETIHMVGSPQIDRLRTTELLTMEQVRDRLSLPVTGPLVLVNWQPETAAKDMNRGLREILRALCGLPEDATVIFAGQNADAGAGEATTLIKEWITNAMPTAKWIANLEPVVYLSLLKHCAVLVGNSSSGSYEAPYYGTQVVNVGRRQRGRDMGPGGVTTSASPDEIWMAVRHAMLGIGKPNPVNLYGDGYACQKIVEVLRRVADPRALAVGAG